MGLDCSHDAFHGAYSAFNRFRWAVATSTGGTWPIMSGDGDYWEFGLGYNSDTHPGLYAFLSHSDCDGELSPGECHALADEMELLLPALADMGMGGGHIERGGGYAGVARAFIAGCRAAAAADEPMEFY